jgi:hypothetical protein
LCLLCARLQIWTYDQQNNKLRPENVKLGNLQRQFRSLEVDELDQFAYAGTTSGDVLQVQGVAAQQRAARAGLTSLQQQ